MSNSEKQAVVYLIFILGLADSYDKELFDLIVPLVKKALEAYNIPIEDGNALVLVNKAQQKAIEEVLSSVEKEYANYEPNSNFIRLVVLEMSRDILRHLNHDERSNCWYELQSFILNGFNYEDYFEDDVMAFEVLNYLKKSIRRFL